MVNTRRRSLISILDMLLVTKYFIFVLMGISLTYRIITLRFKYFLGYDTYFHAAYVEYVIKTGKWINFFPYANAPWGMLINQFHPKGFWAIPVYLDKVLNPLGISSITIFKLTPVIVGVTTVLVVYVALINMYNKEVASISSMFLAISFGHIFRSMAGYYRGDNLILLWYTISLLGISRALRTSNDTPIESKRKRWTLYILSGTAAGLSSLFWSAYYIVFIFLWTSVVIMALGAFVLQKKWALIDSTILTLSLGLGVLLANSLGSRVGYGMFGWNRPDGMKISQILHINLGVIKDAFLFMYLKYAILGTLTWIVVLIVISRITKEKKSRLIATFLIITIMGLIGLYLWNSFGILFTQFLQKLGNGTIVETQRTTLRDVWISYGTLTLIVPFSLLRLRPNRIQIKDLVILGLAIPSLVLLTLWARFLFLSSLAVAILAGIGTWEILNVVKNKTAGTKSNVIALILILLLVVPTGIVSAQNVTKVRPIMNEKWETALNYLGTISHENDIVLSWWDEGYWVMYYTHCGTPSHGVPDEFVARYYLNMTTSQELMNRGIDYVIVSYDLLLKFPSVLKTAGVPIKEYPLIVMPLTDHYGQILMFSTKGYQVLAEPSEKSWKIIVKVGNSSFTPKEAYIEIGKMGPRRVLLDKKTYVNAYVYLNLNYGYAVLMNNRTFSTMLAKLMFTDRYPHRYELVYSDGGYIKIFKISHPNVVADVKNGELYLRFDNATGTSLMLEGFLDDEKRVFRRWYNVKGLDELDIPLSQLNGSVVVRYSYQREGEVLDRGILRVSP